MSLKVVGKLFGSIRFLIEPIFFKSIKTAKVKLQKSFSIAFFTFVTSASGLYL